MRASLGFLERCSADTGFQVSALEKVVRLGELAGDLARHQLLGSALALKGGTALNLCFVPPTRLSVDLDFNVVAHADREAMRESRPLIEAAVEDLARRRGYTVQRSADAFAGRKIHLAFSSVLGGPERIQVDLNYLFRVPFAGVEIRSLWQPGGLDQPHVGVVSLQELCCGKLLALLDRAAPRDLWDVARLPLFAHEVLTSHEFRGQFIAISSILGHPLPSYDRGRLERQVSERDVREQLLPMLVGGEQVDVADLVESAWRVAGPLVELEPGEAAFVAAVQTGEFRPDLLPPDISDAARALAGHPAIMWKLNNAREHSRR